MPDWVASRRSSARCSTCRYSETPLTLALTLEQRRERLHELVIALYRAIVQEQPLVLILDDMHWIDASSQALIEQMTAELAGTPLLLLLIYRRSPGMAESWRELPHGATIALAELPRAANEALLAALLGSELSAGCGQWLNAPMARRSFSKRWCAT